MFTFICFSRLHNAQCPLPKRFATRAPSKSNPLTCMQCQATTCSNRAPHAAVSTLMPSDRLLPTSTPCCLFETQEQVMPLCFLLMIRSKPPEFCACFFLSSQFKIICGTHWKNCKITPGERALRFVPKGQRFIS